MDAPPDPPDPPLNPPPPTQSHPHHSQDSNRLKPRCGRAGALAAPSTDAAAMEVHLEAANPPSRWRRMKTWIRAVSAFLHRLKTQAVASVTPPPTSRLRMADLQRPEASLGLGIAFGLHALAPVLELSTSALEGTLQVILPVELKELLKKPLRLFIGTILGLLAAALWEKVFCFCADQIDLSFLTLDFLIASPPPQESQSTWARRALQKAKSNQASTLDQTIHYLKLLQQQVQAMSVGLVPAAVYPVVQPQCVPPAGTPVAVPIPTAPMMVLGHPPSTTMVPFGTMLQLPHYAAAMAPLYPASAPAKASVVATGDAMSVSLSHCHGSSSRSSGKGKGSSRLCQRGRT